MSQAELEEMSMGNYKILLDGDKIGEIFSDPCRLTDIEIDEEHRGEGHGKEALKQWVDMKEGDCDELLTTPVMSDAMEHLLEEEGFKKEETLIDGQFRYRRVDGLM